MTCSPIKDSSLERLQRRWRFLLLPMSYCFQGVVTLRHFLYEKGILKVYKCGVPVVSVGNIIAGGSGKTPFTLLLAKTLSKMLPIAIVSRGYRRENESTPRIVSKGNGPLLAPEKSGDEPYMLSKNCPEAIVVVDKDRVRGAQTAEKLGAKLVILDDGMQHRRVHRDVEIVCLRESDLTSRFLPAGLLREHPKRLKNADMLVVSGFNSQLFSQTNIVEVEHRVKEIVFLDPQRKIPLQEAPVAIFCGIASPQSFVETVESLGMRILLCRFLPDHGKMSQKDLKSFADEAKAKGAVCILCTEKDSVKLEHQTLSLPIAWVKREAAVKNGGPFLQAMLENITSRCL